MDYYCVQGVYETRNHKKNAKSYFHCDCGLLSTHLIELKVHMGIQVTLRKYNLLVPGIYTAEYSLLIFILL